MEYVVARHGHARERAAIGRNPLFQGDIICLCS